MSLEIRKIGVIGAGQMGKGIAHVCAVAGFDVALNDVSNDRISAGIDDIAAQLQKSVERGTIDATARDSAIARITPAPAMQDFRDADLVIEAASESEEIKRKILSDIALALKPDAIIGTNTSSISITRLAAVTGRPERFIGIHFINPVPKMQLVELNSRHSDGRSHIRRIARLYRKARQDDNGLRRFSGLYR